MAYYGLEAVALDNNVSAQIWSVDYNLSLDDPYSNIYRSEAMQLPAVFYYRGYLFEDACTDTCLVAGLGFNATNYTLQIDIGNAELEIGAIDYIVSVKDFIVNETLVQHDAEIGKPVKWTKTNTYDLAKPGHSMNISINAENITVFKKKGTKMVAVGDLDAEIRSEGIVKTIREHNLEKQIENLQKIIEKEARPQEKDNLKDRLDNLAAELKQVASAIESDFISIDIAEIVVPSETDTIEIEYYTPAPETIETNISPTSKQVVVTSEEHYADILTYASLPSEAEPESVHLYWIVNGTRNEVFDITKKDTNDNGLVDWIEWVTPHLSNQTYVIEITGEGLYNWSAGMFYNTTTDWENVTLLNDSADTYYTSGHYISQTFDAGNETRWMNINWGEIVIPYSQVVLLEDGFEDISWDAKWQDNGVTDWSNSTDLQASGSYSAENIGTNNDNDMISNDINTSIASDIRVFFWYNKDKLEDGDFSIQIYDGSSYNNWHDLDVYNGPDFCAGNGGDGTWCRFNEVITDSQYFRDNFRLKFEGTETDLNERVAIDDVNITYARETNIAVKTRTSNDNIIWSAWSSNHTNPSGLINASARYLQYKALLTTLNNYDTPFLQWVNITYGIEYKPTVTLNHPVNNNSINLDNVVFNCSAADSEGNLTSISLYSDYKGSWQLIETKELTGFDNSTTFTKNIVSEFGDNIFIDAGFKWNCLAYNSPGLAGWGASNYTFSSWEFGSYANTTVDLESIALLNATANSYYMGGHYVSQVFDAGSQISWDDIRWQENLSYSYLLLEDGFEDVDWDAKWDDNGITDWNLSLDLKVGGNYSAENVGSNDDNDLISDNLDASGSSEVRVFFWYNKDALDTGDIYVQLYNGSSYNDWHDLDVYGGPDLCAENDGDDRWCRFDETITHSQYFRQDFRLKFEGTGTGPNEGVAIDDVSVISLVETSMAIQTRTSNDNTTWTAWSSNRTNPSGLINSSARYLQYKAILATPDNHTTPRLGLINISYGAESKSAVTLNQPANNNSVTLDNVTFNCSVISPAAELANISLYSDYPGTWQLIETKSLTGTDNSTTFTKDVISELGEDVFIDSGFRWNCQAYNILGLGDWGDSDSTFSNWDLGSHSNTAVILESLALLNAAADKYYMDGYYVSQVFDAGSEKRWDNISWVTSVFPFNESVIFEDEFEDISWDAKWQANGVTDWSQSLDRKVSGNYSAENLGSNDDNDLISNDINISGAPGVRIFFWYNKDKIEDGDFYIELYNGSSYNSWHDLDIYGGPDLCAGNKGDGTWCRFDETITDPHYLIGDFRLKFEGTRTGVNERVSIDDVKITYYYPTSLEIQTRTSEDNIIWTPWSSDHINPSGLITTCARYLQYKAILTTLTEYHTPTLDFVNISYASTSKPTVALNYPVNNNAISLDNVLFNCSAADSAAELVNISLYSDYRGDWQLIETKELAGTSNSTTFTRNIVSELGENIFLDAGFRWNCLAYNDLEVGGWGDSDATFSNWDIGSYGNTTVDEGIVALLNDSANSYYMLGSYASQVFDAGGETSWDDLIWDGEVSYLSVILEDGFEDIDWDAKWDNNGLTDWSLSSNMWVSGSYSAENLGSNDDNDLISDNLDSSGSSEVRVFFWYNKDALDTGDIYIQLYNGTSYNTWHDLDIYDGPDFCAGNGGDDRWCRFNETITASQYFRQNFRLKFDGTGTGTNEMVAIDDVLVISIVETSMAIQTRTSNDNVTWTPWSSSHSNPSGLINLSARYLQYKSVMATPNNQSTPLLRLVNLSYGTESKPMVSLNYPSNNNSVSFGNVTFNCSAADSAGNLANISLYSDYPGSWQLIETKSLTGFDNSTTFIKDIASELGENVFVDSGFRWNCLASNTLDLTDWGDRDYRFSNWDFGTYANVIIDNGVVGLMNYTAGEYLSSVFDAGSLKRWKDISWETDVISFNQSELLEDGFEDIDWDVRWDDNGVTDWSHAIERKVSGTYSAENLGTNDDNDLVSDNIDASGAQGIRIFFWYNKNRIEDGDFYVELYNGSSYNLWQDLDVYGGPDFCAGNGGDGTWCRFDETIIDSQYLIDNFRLKFEGTETDVGERVTIDDIRVDYYYPTNLTVLTRTSDDNISWTPWSAGLANPSGLINASARYLQYKAELETKESSLTPHLMSVNIDYSKVWPNISKFSLTTNMSEVSDVGIIENLTLGLGGTTVVWLNPVNATAQDYDSHINIGSGFVSINVSELSDDINTSANVTFENVDCNRFKLYYAEGFYSSRFSFVSAGNLIADETNIDGACDDSLLCLGLSCSGGVLNFIAQHFDGFGVGVIKWINATSPVGFGDYVTIDTEIAEGDYTLDTVLAGITVPGYNEVNYTMPPAYVIDDYTNYTNGTYNYVVYVNNTDGEIVSENGWFDMWVNMSVSVMTLDYRYLLDEIVDLS